jgi:hypothetical protein
LLRAMSDGAGVVSHAGSRLLADVADRTTLTGELSQVLDGLRPARARHDPGRVLVDLAVAVADGATTISEIAVLGEQAELFGAVASDSTCWRLLDRLADTTLARVAAARARARVVAQADTEDPRGIPGRYGCPRVHAELRLGLGIEVNHKLVARLMREASIQGLHRRRRRGCTVRDPPGRALPGPGQPRLRHRRPGRAVVYGYHRAPHAREKLDSLTEFVASSKLDDAAWATFPPRP